MADLNQYMDVEQTIPKGHENSGSTLDTHSNQTKRKLLTLGGFVSLALVVAACNSKIGSKGYTTLTQRNLSAFDRFVGAFYEQRDGYWRTNGDALGEDDTQIKDDVNLGKKWQKADDGKVNGEDKKAELGYSVAMSGNAARVAVGCPGDGNNHEGSVMAYNYKKDQAGDTIKGDDDDGNTGTGLDISDNGQWMIVGEPHVKMSGNKDAGRVRTYMMESNKWKQKGGDVKGKNSNEECGTTVAIDENGKRMIVGCPGKQKARIYKMDNDKWKQIDKDITSGGTVSMTTDGKNVAVSNPDKDQVTNYEVSSSSWKKMGSTLKEDNEYGQSISITKTQNVVRLAVGMGKKKDVRTYEWDPDKKKWDEEDKITSIKGKAVSFTPNYLAVGDYSSNSDKGVVKIFERKNNGDLKQVGKDIKGSNKDDKLGHSVQIDPKGKFVFVGSPGVNNDKGRAQLYEYK